jgi:4-hydroxy-tetrahydrodipicolinate reductase
MRIALLGYGKMGKLIRQTALARGHKVTAVIDPQSDLPEVTASAIDPQTLNGAEVVIDFTVPAAAVDNIKAVAACNAAMVVGTTGWYEREREVRDIIAERGTALIWSGNFSLGVNMLFALIRNAGMIMDSAEEYDVMVHEFHHAAKADSPSGTAQMIGNILLETLGRKNRIVSDTLGRRIEADELHITSTRGGSIPGTHSVIFDSPDDTIEITHRARSRAGFAAGAVKAAEWICGRTGYFTISDMMQSIIDRGQA